MLVGVLVGLFVGVLVGLLVGVLVGLLVGVLVGLLIGGHLITGSILPDCKHMHSSSIYIDLYF